MSNNSESQVSGDAAENYDQIASLTMLPWAGNLVASANLTAGERVLDLACGTGVVGRSTLPAGPALSDARPSLLLVPPAMP